MPSQLPRQILQKKKENTRTQNSDFFQNMIWTLTKSIISVFFANNLCPCYTTIFKKPGKPTLKKWANLSWLGAQQECPVAGIHVCCNGHGVEGIWMQMFFFSCVFFWGGMGGGEEVFVLGRFLFHVKRSCSNLRVFWNEKQEWTNRWNVVGVTFLCWSRCSAGSGSIHSWNLQQMWSWDET